MIRKKVYSDDRKYTIGEGSRNSFHRNIPAQLLKSLPNIVKHTKPTFLTDYIPKKKRI